MNKDAQATLKNGSLEICEVISISNTPVDSASLKSHANKFVKSYYEQYSYYLKNYGFVNNLVVKNWVNTGKVDLWTVLGDANDNIDDNLNLRNMESLENELTKTRTKFMSECRIVVCKYAVQLLYSDIMTILSEYSTISDDIAAREQ